MSLLRNQRDQLSPSARSTSYKIEADRARSGSGQKLVQERHPKYDLKWSKLKKWLERKFPTVQFNDQVVAARHSHSVFQRLKVAGMR